jgi:hypothetical protein
MGHGRTKGWRSEKLSIYYGEEDKEYPASGNEKRRGTAVLTCLYLTSIKPSRRSAQQFTDWLQANHPDCSFTEFNVGKKSFPVRNGGRYLGQVEGPAAWGDAARSADRQTVLDTARRMLAA